MYEERETPRPCWEVIGTGLRLRKGLWTLGGAFPALLTGAGLRGYPTARRAVPMRGFCVMSWPMGYFIRAHKVINGKGPDPRRGDIDSDRGGKLACFPRQTLAWEHREEAGLYDYRKYRVSAGCIFSLIIWKALVLTFESACVSLQSWSSLLPPLLPSYTSSLYFPTTLRNQELYTLTNNSTTLFINPAAPFPRLTIISKPAASTNLPQSNHHHGKHRP